jgi:hypothetical protein
VYIVRVLTEYNTQKTLNFYQDDAVRYLSRGGIKIIETSNTHTRTYIRHDNNRFPAQFTTGELPHNVDGVTVKKK